MRNRAERRRAKREVRKVTEKDSASAKTMERFRKEYERLFSKPSVTVDEWKIRQGMPDHDGNAGRRICQVKQVTRQGGTKRDGKRLEDCPVKVELYNGRKLQSDPPWEIAEARLAELQLFHGVEATLCGCLNACLRADTVRRHQECDKPGIVLCVFDNIRFPFCEDCARKCVQHYGAAVLDWLPDDI